MKTTSAPATCIPPNSNPTAKSHTVSNAGGRPNWLRQDHPCPTPPSSDCAAKVLTLDEMCDWYIIWMLNRCGGNREATARVLGIGRTSLYRYLKMFERE